MKAGKKEETKLLSRAIERLVAKTILHNCFFEKLTESEVRCSPGLVAPSARPVLAATVRALLDVGPALARQAPARTHVASCRGEGVTEQGLLRVLAQLGRWGFLVLRSHRVVHGYPVSDLANPERFKGGRAEKQGTRRVSESM